MTHDELKAVLVRAIRDNTETFAGGHRVDYDAVTTAVMDRQNGVRLKTLMDVLEPLEIMAEVTPEWYKTATTRQKGKREGMMMAVDIVRGIIGGDD